MKKIIIVFFVVFGICLFMYSIFNFNYQPSIKNGISIGNGLDSPLAEDWGVTVTNDLIREIKDKGFDSVRLPVRFSDYIDENYKLDEEFMMEIDGYINYAISIDLKIILDLHHFVELIDASTIGNNDSKQLPSNFDYLKAYYSIWEQLSIRYKDYSNLLFFEIFNEPSGDITSDDWNEMVEKTLNIIRKTNPSRKVIVSTANMAIVEEFDNLVIPEDKNIIVTFHYYLPLDFVFQNDENHIGYESDDLVYWDATDENINLIREKFQIAKEFSDKHNVEVLVGEFGVNKLAPEESRIIYTNQIAKISREFGFGYIYWELAHNFGIYDVEKDEWNEEMVSALLK